MFFSTLKTAMLILLSFFICYAVKGRFWGKRYIFFALSKPPSKSRIFQVCICLYFVTWAWKKRCSYASFTEAKDHRLYDFLFNFDPCNMPYGICGKIPLFARVFTAHQGFFLKSSKLVVNSNCTLANIFVFQGVWGLIIKV